MNKKKFINVAIRYGGIVVLLGVLLDVYAVMRYRELFNEAMRKRDEAQQVDQNARRMQALLQEFASRAGSDGTILQILQRAQQRNAAPAATPAPTP